jgi:quercetin dioxygenase-like cupin family protein
MSTTQPQPLPPDDLHRKLALAQLGSDQLGNSSTLPHIGLVGDTYTITVTGEDTAGRFSVIDMHIPPGGGPPPHRHDFEETFILLDGEMQATFRGEKIIVKAGDTITIPANAPHQFKNISSQPVRLICICSPAGQEKFFMEVGIPVATRTTPAPKLSAEQQAEFMKKALELAPKYRTEFLQKA